MSTPDIVYATEAHAGAHCPLCGEPIRVHQLVRLVGEARTPTHSRCWENQGAARKSARPGEPAHSADEASSAQPLDSNRAADEDGAPETLESPAPKITLILVAFIISVIGPIIGIVVGSLWLGPESSPVRRRDGRELLVICSVLFVIQVAMFALMLSGALGALSGAAQFPLGLPF